MTSSRCWPIVVAALVAGVIGLSLIGPGSAPGQQGKKGKDKARPPETGPVDPRGKPDAFAAGKRSMYAVWTEEGAWHLRVTAKKGTRDVFTGTVRLNRGKVLGKFEGLEKGAKEDADWIFPHRDGMGFDFRFVNVGKLDEVSFKVSDPGAELLFTMKIDDAVHPDRVLIGKKGRHPDKVPFTLPAAPPK